MTKAIYAVAGALALSMTSAWASEAKVQSKRASETVASQQSTRLAPRPAKTVAKSASEGGTGSGAASDGGSVRMNPIDPTLPHAERWILEREGYRDGGY